MNCLYHHNHCSGRKTYLWKTFIFNNTFSFKISIYNWLIILTLFEQMDCLVDSTRLRYNKFRLNIFIFFASYIDMCTGWGNVCKCVNDNIAHFMWIALFIQILLCLFVRTSANKEAGIFIMFLWNSILIRLHKT